MVTPLFRTPIGQPPRRFTAPQAPAAATAPPTTPGVPRFTHAGQVGTPTWTPPDTLFAQQVVRDTASYRPLTLLRIRIPRGRTIFVVNNTTNQTVTATLIGDHVNAPATAPDIGGATTIASTSFGTIATDIGSPWLGIRISFGTAPTSGTVSVTASTERDPFNPI